MKFLGTTGLETLARLAKQKFVSADNINVVYIAIENSNLFVPRNENVFVDELYFDESLPDEWCLHCIENGITSGETDSKDRIYTIQFSPDVNGQLTISYITPFVQHSYYYIRGVNTHYSMGMSTYVTNTDMVIIRMSVPANVSFEVAKQYLVISIINNEDNNKLPIEMNEYYAIDRPTIDNILHNLYADSDLDTSAVDKNDIDAIIAETYINGDIQENILSDEDVDLILS